MPSVTLGGFDAASSLRASLLAGTAIAAVGLLPILAIRRSRGASVDPPATADPTAVAVEDAPARQASAKIAASSASAEIAASAPGPERSGALRRSPLRWSALPSFRLPLHWRQHRSSFQVIGVFIFIGLLTSMSGGMVVPYLNVYFEDRFATSASVIGLVVASGQAMTALAYFVGPWAAKRYGETRSVTILQLCSVPFLLVTAYTASFAWAAVGYLFRQAFMNAVAPFYTTIKMKYVDSSLHGLAASSGEAVYHLGWFLAAPVSSGLVAHYGSYYGYAYTFTITSFMYIVISLLFYYFLKRWERKAD